MSTKNNFLSLYRTNSLIRKCENAIRREYSSDALKTPVHLCNGSEAIATGVLSALPPNSKIFGTYRNHGLYLARTNDTDGFFAELYGKKTGCAQGKAGSMHLTSPNHGFILTSAVVGTTIPVAVGAALASQYMKEKKWTVVFFGDGALEEGSFWESVNFACLHQLPVVFVCEDNDLAIHASGKERRGYKTILEVIRGFDCLRAGGDGYHPLKVQQLSGQAFQKAKKQKKPLFLYLKYFRQLEHVGVNEDFKANYRKMPSQSELNKMDPVALMRKAAIRYKCTTLELDGIDRELDIQIEQSIAKAKKAEFPPKSALREDVVASHG